MRNLLTSLVFLAPLLLLTACGGGDSSGDSAFMASDPPLQTQQAKLDKALNCTKFEHKGNPPVLLVHGTFTNGNEQFTAFYTPQLVALGYDVCIVTYPDRGLIDQQTSAEYIVNALDSIYSQTGRKVAMIGHSQGASMPRFALRFFPSARAALQDFVLIAGPNHGTTVSQPTDLLQGLLGATGLDILKLGLPESLYQFSPNSKFNAAINTVDETPGDIDYTSLYGNTDELVEPAAPIPTAGLDFGKNNPHVANILLQKVCPLHITDHVTIGTTDPLAFALALDAISHPGPANFQRAGGDTLCSLLPLDLNTLVRPESATELLSIVAGELQTDLPDPHLAAGEPPLRPYAQAALDQAQK